MSQQPPENQPVVSQEEVKPSFGAVRRWIVRRFLPTAALTAAGAVVGNKLGQPGYEDAGRQVGLQQGEEAGIDAATKEIVGGLEDIFRSGMTPADQLPLALTQAQQPIFPLLETSTFAENSSPDGRITLADGKVVARDGGQVVFDPQMFELNATFSDVSAATLSPDGRLLLVDATRKPSEGKIAVETPLGVKTVSNWLPVPAGEAKVRLLIVRPQDKDSAPQYIEIPPTAQVAFTGNGKLLIVSDDPTQALIDSGTTQLDGETKLSHVIHPADVLVRTLSLSGDKLKEIDRRGFVIQPEEPDPQNPRVADEWWQNSPIAVNGDGYFIAYTLASSVTRIVNDQLQREMESPVIITVLASDRSHRDWRITPAAYYKTGQGKGDAADMIADVSKGGSILGETRQSLDERVSSVRLLGPGPKGDSFLVAFGGTRSVSRGDKTTVQPFSKAIAIARPFSDARSDKADLTFIPYPEGYSIAHVNQTSFGIDAVTPDGQIITLSQDTIQKVYEGKITPQEAAKKWAQ